MFTRVSQIIGKLASGRPVGQALHAMVNDS